MEAVGRGDALTLVTHSETVPVTRSEVWERHRPLSGRKATMPGAVERIKIMTRRRSAREVGLKPHWMVRIVILAR